MIRNLVIFTCMILFTGCTVSKYAPDSPETLPPPVTDGSISLEFIQMIGQESRLRAPGGMSYCIDGTLFVCDLDRSSVIRLDSNGAEIARYNGNRSRSGRLFVPIDVSSTDGLTVYVVDGAGSRLMRLDRNLRNAYPILDAELEGGGLFGTFNGLAFDRTTGDIYLTDVDSGSVLRINMLGRNVQNMGSFGSGEQSMIEPVGIDISWDGDVYVADPSYGAIARMNRMGDGITFFGSEHLVEPVDVVWIDSVGIAVADMDGVVILSPGGEALGSAGYGVDRIMNPRSVAYGDGKLFISDALSGSILVYQLRKRSGQ